MTKTALSPGSISAEDDQTSAPAVPRETANDSGVQRDGSGGPVPKLCPVLGDESGAALTFRQNVPTHDDRGKFAAGNQAARQHGTFAVHQPPELLEVVDGFETELLSDLGGARVLSTLERSCVANLRALKMTLMLLAADIETRGLVTPHGGVRRSYAAFLAGVDRFDRLSQRLGMKRRTKRVPSAHELLQQPHTQEESTP